MKNIITTKIILFCLFVGFSENQYAQNNDQYVEIETYIYKPKKIIKKIVDKSSIDPRCFHPENGTIVGRQHILLFIYNSREKKYFLNTMNASSVINETMFLNNVFFDGVFYHNGDLVFIDFSNDKTNKTKRFFRNTNKKIKIKVPITILDVFCDSSYEIKKNKFKLINNFESWNLNGN